MLKEDVSLGLGRSIRSDPSKHSSSRPTSAVHVAITVPKGPWMPKASGDADFGDIPATLRERPFFYLLAAYQIEFVPWNTFRFPGVQPGPAKLRFMEWELLTPPLQAQANNTMGFTCVIWVAAVDAADKQLFLVGHVRVFSAGGIPADFGNSLHGAAGAAFLLNTTRTPVFVAHHLAGDTTDRNSFRISL